MAPPEDKPPADARKLGRAVRLKLKSLGLDWSVKSQTVSFAGLGYGECPFATITTTRLLTPEERNDLALTLKGIAEIPHEEGGGRAIISLEGPDYSFGGTIYAKDYQD